MEHKDDEGLVGEAVHGVIHFEGRTLDDCLRSIALAVRQITNGHSMGSCYMRDEARAAEVGFYSFEVDSQPTEKGEIDMPETSESERGRMLLAELINSGGVPAGYDGPLWDTQQMQDDFEPIGFAAPFIVVRRRSDGQKGTLTFVHHPRVYFNFQPTS